MAAAKSKPAKQPRAAGVMVIVAYRPKRGMGPRLLALTRRHLPILRRLGLVTAHPASVMRAADGTIVEVFEWTSRAALDAAHLNPAVTKMWGEYGKVCDYLPLGELKESANLFAEFQPVHFK